MKCLDICTGRGSFAKVAKDLGHSVVTLDIDPRCKPDILADVMHLDYKSVFQPGEFDFVWCSPPCTTFSCARKCNIGREVNTLAQKGKKCIFTHDTIKLERETIGVPILRKCQEIIAYISPKTFIIENPYTGAMKEYIDYPPAIVDYCMFGFDYRKRTALWSNKVIENKICDRSHLQGGRHKMTAIGNSKTQKGQGGGESKTGRYAVPRELIHYIFNSVGVTDVVTCEECVDVGASVL